MSQNHDFWLLFKAVTKASKTQHMLFLGYHGASGYPKSHQKFIFCEYECNIRKKAEKNKFLECAFSSLFYCVIQPTFKQENGKKCSKLPKLNFSYNRRKAFSRQSFCTKWSFWSKEMFFIHFKPKKHILKDKFDFWNRNAQSPK